MILGIKSAHRTAIIKLKNQILPRHQAKLDNPLQVVLSHRMRSCAGRAIAGHTIKLNYRLLTQNLSELEPTYLHELAHIFAYRFYQARGHDHHWRQLMAWMGQSPQRTHQMDVSRLQYQQQRYSYRCHCSEHLLSAHRHTKIRRGVTYQCRRCQGILVSAQPVSPQSWAT